MTKAVNLINELISIVDNSDKIILQKMLQKYLAKKEFILVEDYLLIGLNLKNTNGMSIAINKIWYKAMAYANTIMGRTENDEFFLNILPTFEKDSIGMEIYNLASEMQIQRYYIYHNSDVLIKKEMLESFDFFALTTFVNKILNYEGFSLDSI